MEKKKVRHLKSNGRLVMNYGKDRKFLTTLLILMTVLLLHTVTVFAAEDEEETVAENIVTQEVDGTDEDGIVTETETEIEPDGTITYGGEIKASDIKADPDYDSKSGLKLNGDTKLILDDDITFSKIECGDGYDNFYALTVEGKKTLNICGDRYDKYGICNASSLTLNSGTINISSQHYYAMSNCGDITINGGSFIILAFDGLESKSGNITINGGEIRINYESSPITCNKKLKITGGTVTVEPQEGASPIGGIKSQNGIEITGGIVSHKGYMTNDFEDIIIGGNSKVTIDNSYMEFYALYMPKGSGSGEIKINGIISKPVGGRVKEVLDDDAYSYTIAVGDTPADYVEIVCGSAVIPVQNVELAPTTKGINTGATFTLNATISPANATNKNIIWKSSNESVATVTGEGLSATVRGVTAGTATIRATSADNNSKYAECKVTVTDPVVKVTGVSLDPASATVKVGATKNLTAGITPSNATNKKVSWNSSNTKVATVTGSGLSATVKGISPGKATITVKTEDGGKTASCTVTVPPVPVTGITLDKNSATLLPDKTLQLTAVIKPDNATNKGVRWSSNKTKIAKVNGSGKVTAVAPGTAKITAEAADGSGVVTTATIKVAGMTLNDNVLVVRKGEKSTGIKAKLTNDTISKVTPSKKNIVEVKFDKKKGTFSIKGKKVGKTKLKISSTAGITQNLEVTVQKSKVTTEKLVVSKKNVTLKKKNKKAVVTVTATPDRISTGEDIKVTSDNKKVAKVSINQNTGKITITAAGKGECKVTVKAGDVKKTIKVKVKK